MHISVLRIPEPVQCVIRDVMEAGGRPLIVGGGVVDLIQGREPKDWDIEVFSCGYDELAEILEDYAPKFVGRSFGIIKLSREKCDGYDIDVSVPRVDNAVGVGHKDFEVVLDPSMPVKEAMRRRDFSVNSLAWDPVTGDVLDEWGGLLDLEAGVLRATDPELFVQDPVRPLRAMQLLARKCDVIDPPTLELCRSMSDTFETIAGDRVREEFKKLLLKAERPSVGLELLREMDWLKHFPALDALVECEQHPDWHPEGDVWEHTLRVVDNAAWARDKVAEEWREAFMFGCLLHDVGKPSTTVTPEMIEAGEHPMQMLWTAHGHDQAGREPAEQFMAAITQDKTLIERVVLIVAKHLQPCNLTMGESKPAAWKRLHNKIRLDVLGWVSRADGCAHPSKDIDDPELVHENSENCWKYVEEFGINPIKPLLLGRHLIKAGLKPGPHFTKRLAAAFDAQLEGEEDIEKLTAIALAVE
jgi:tRNA nucleotidyltransferase (CCA-adding enzyme)